MQNKVRTRTLSQTTQVLTRGAARLIKDSNNNINSKAAVGKTAAMRMPLAQKTANAKPQKAGPITNKPTANPRKRPATDNNNNKAAPVKSETKENESRVHKGGLQKPLPNIESIKKLNPTVNALADSLRPPLAKKSRFEGWDDLDKDDDLDPLMVNEYVVEIFDYMKELEIETKPDPNYMANQTELKWKMRSILVDWLVDVHSKFRLLPETLYLAINLIDRFLSLRIVSCAKLQLVGVAAMFIASKYEEICHPTIANFIFLADGGYTEDEVLKAERYLLQVLNFGLQYPNPMNFLRRCSKAENYNLQTRTLAKYLMEITLMDHRFLDYVPSIIAAAGLFLARKMLNTGPWDVNLSHYSSYSEDELKPVVNLMIEYLSKSQQFDGIYNKYCTKRFMKSAIFVQNWVKKNAATVEKLAAEKRGNEVISDFEEEDGEDENDEDCGVDENDEGDD